MRFLLITTWLLTGMPAMATSYISWNPRLGSIGSALVIWILAVFLVLLYRRSNTIRSARQSLLLLAPKILMVLLLVLALFDPKWTTVEQSAEGHKVLALLDTSSSMDVADDGRSSREARAEKILARIEKDLGKNIDVERVGFHQDLSSTEASDDKETLRNTDLGASLIAARRSRDLQNYVAMLTLTDGGDEPIQLQQDRELPLFTVGVGSDPADWNDLAIHDIEAPLTAEKAARFTISIDLKSYSKTPAFAEKLSAVKVTLQEKDESGWRYLDSETVSVNKGRHRMDFTVEGSEELGTRYFRVVTDQLEGELSLLNNTSPFEVDVRDAALRVLIYGRSIGWDFTGLKAELSSDPGISLTSIFAVSGDSVIDERSRQDSLRLRRLPSDAAVLKSFQVIILGSFQARHLNEHQIGALKTYVENGGALVFMGGSESFGRGGWHETDLAPLFPWYLGDDEPPLRVKRYMAAVPLTSRELGIIAETAKVLDGATQVSLDALNLPGRLRPAALPILEASSDNATVAAIAQMRYGSGKVMAIASNALWKWRRSSQPALKDAYRAFWRSSLRSLAGLTEGGQFIQLKWDQPFYRPGETAKPTISIAGRHTPGAVSLRGQLSIDGTSIEIPFSPGLSFDNDFRAQIPFLQRGDYTLALEAYDGDKLLETYTKVLHVAPRLNEGARLEVDHAFLNDLAASTGGAHFRENQISEIAAALKETLVTRSQVVAIPLVQKGFVFFGLFLLVIVAELFLRKQRHLV